MPMAGLIWGSIPHAALRNWHRAGSREKGAAMSPPDSTSVLIYTTLLIITYLIMEAIAWIQERKR